MPPARDLAWYRRLAASLSQEFGETFGYELRDVFDDLRGMLEEGRPFAFSRFGDGEFYAIFGAEGENCDGHRYFPDMGRRLAEIVAAEPPYLMALNPVALAMHDAERLRASSGGTHWVSGFSIQRVMMDGRGEEIFGALAGRDVLLVGPEHLRELARGRKWDQVTVPSRDCWLRYEDVRESIRSRLEEPGAVVLFCASMMSNVLIDELWEEMPGNSYIDIGSSFDPLVGVSSRTYHDAAFERFAAPPPR